MHSDEISHSQTLLQLYSNPQSGSESSQYTSSTNRKATLHYGTYLDVAKGETINTSDITQDDQHAIQELQNTIQDLKNRQDTFEQGIMSKINNAVDTKISPLQQEVKTLKSSCESQIGEVLNTINEMRRNQTNDISAAVSNAMAAFFKKNPNGRAELPYGGNQ